MKPLGFPLLADEDIHPHVIAAPIAHGKDVRTVRDEGLIACADVDILRRAFRAHSPTL